MSERRMKDGGWMMKDGGWRMKDEGGRGALPLGFDVQTNALVRVRVRVMRNSTRSRDEEFNPPGLGYWVVLALEREV